MTSRAARERGAPGRKKNQDNSLKNRLRGDLAPHKSAILRIWHDWVTHPTYDARAAAINEYLAERGMLGVGVGTTVWRALRGQIK